MWSQESVLQSKTRLSFFSKKIKLALEFNVRRLCDCEILIWIDFSKNKKKYKAGIIFVENMTAAPPLPLPASY